MPTVNTTRLLGVYENKEIEELVTTFPKMTYLTLGLTNVYIAKLYELEVLLPHILNNARSVKETQPEEGDVES